MLGIKVRGINHLYNLADNSSDGVTMFTLVGTTQVLEYRIFAHVKKNMVLAVRKNPYGFDRPMSNYSIDDVKESQRAAFNAFRNEYNEPCVINRIRSNTGGFGGTLFGTLSVVVSETFEEDYNAFKKVNTKLLNGIFGKYLLPNNVDSRLLFAVCDGNPNFFAWAAKMTHKYGISIHTICHFMDFVKTHGQLVKDTTKGNIIALSTARETARGLTEIFNLRAQAIAKASINWFGSTQKKLLREKLGNNEAVHVINNFSRLSKTKRMNFIRKVTTITDADEILKMMSYLCTNTHFDWNKPSFMEFLHNVDNLNFEVVFDKENVVVLRVKDYETIKRLGKTTNWCISKNRQYWEQYMGRRSDDMLGDPFVDDAEVMMEPIEEAEEDENESIYDKRFNELARSRSKDLNNSSKPMQFMVFDFGQPEDSNHSIVGFTATTMKGVTHAHDFTNNNMMGGSQAQPILVPQVTRWRINAWVPENGNASADGDKGDSKIAEFLNKNGIDLGELCKYEYPFCKWNKEDVKKHIEYYCAPEDYTLIYESDDKLILRSYTHHMTALLPQLNLMARPMAAPSSRNPLKERGRIWHLDFSKNGNDLDKIIYWGVFENLRTHVETTSVPCNETGSSVSKPFGSFIEMLDHYGLDFDVIKRPNTLIAKANEYLEAKKYSKAFELIKECLAENKDKRFYEVGEKLSSIFDFNTSGRNLKFWHQFAASDIDFKRILSQDKMRETIYHILAYMVNRIIDCGETSKRTNLYRQCKTVEGFYALSEKNEKEWDEYRNKDGISNSKLRSKAHFFMCMHDISGYGLIADIFISKMEENGMEGMYSNLIPSMLRLLNDYGMNGTMVNNWETMKGVINHFLKENLSKWNGVEMKDINTLVQLMQYEGFSTIALAKFSALLKTVTRPSQIDRIVISLDHFSNGNYTDKTFKKALDMVTSIIKEKKILSESACSRIVASRVATT